MEEHDILIQQIQTLENKLKQEQSNNKQRNHELQQQFQYLSRDLDTLFASKTWKIGYGISNLYRRVLSWIGRKEDGQYMNADHFKNLIESCEYYTHRKTQLTPTLKQTLAGKFPKSHYEKSKVSVMLKDLWQEQRIEKDKL